jgi:hypothetical protein
MSVHLLDQVVDAHLAGVELDVVSVLYAPELASVALLPLPPKLEPVYSVAPLSPKLPIPQFSSGVVHVLKVTSTIPPILDSRGSTVVAIFIPFIRASGGRRDAKILAVFPAFVKGLKLIAQLVK